MFILTTFSDLVQIPPHELWKIPRVEIEDKINEKYSNKVVQKVGLCICMYDLLKASDGLIGHGTGNVNVNAEFNMIVFRPFKGEILTAKILKCTPEGIRLTTEFFQDIFVPKTMLDENTRYEPSEDSWVWSFPDSDVQLFFDEGLVVYCRVEAEKWQDQFAQETDALVKTESDGVTYRRPYSIEASMAEVGLGGVDWW